MNAAGRGLAVLIFPNFTVTKAEYRQRLLDPRWQRVRTEVLKHADFRCQVCGSDIRTLHVHHSYYARNTEPQDYPMGCFIAACGRCHKIADFARKHRDWLPEEVQPAPAPLPPPETGPPVSEERALAYFAEMRAIIAGDKPSKPGENAGKTTHA